MTTRTSRPLLWLAAFAALVFIGLAGAAGSAAAQGKPTAQQTPVTGPEAVNSYNLYGDVANTLGNNNTVFQTNDSYVDDGNTIGFEFIDSKTDDTTIKASGAGTGIYGVGSNYGVYGESTDGFGVFSYSASNDSVHAQSGYGVAVYGSSDHNDGIYGFSPSKYGVHGVSGNSDGVYGESSSTYGVHGASITGDGVFGTGSSHGVQGRSANIGVYGYGDVFGVYAYSGPGDAISGYSAANGKSGVVGYNGSAAGLAYGVRGASISSAGYGGYFTATSGIGLYGRSPSNYGVLGSSNSSYGVRATSNSSYGLLASSVSSVGVRGTSSDYYGFYAGSGSGTGGYAYTASGQAAFRAKNNQPDVAGHYGIISDGDVLVNGNITCSGSCLLASSVKTSSGERLLYSDSSAQSVASDQGTATLKDGRAVIKIDPVFAQVVSLNAGYQVFVTPGSDETAGLAVVNKTSGSFEVHELNKGQGSFSFDWRLTAVRKGYEKTRLEKTPQVSPPATEPDVPAFTDPGTAAAPDVSADKQR